MMTMTAYSLSAFRQIIASNELFPSNYKVRKYWDKDSISETLNLATNPDIFKREKNEAVAHWQGKSVRFAARFLSIWTVGLIFAPIGTVYHGFQAIKFTLLILKGSEDGGESENWKRAKQHAIAFATDLIFTSFMSLMALSLVAGVSSLILETAFTLTHGLGWLVVPQIIPAILASRPEFGLVFMEPSRLEFQKDYKVLFLKNQFGVCDLKGKILTNFNPEADDEKAGGYPRFNWKGKGHFYDLRRAKGDELYSQLKSINSRLGRFAFKNLEELPSPHALIVIKGSLDEILKNCSIFFSTAEIEKLNKTYQEFREIQNYLLFASSR